LTLPELGGTLAARGRDGDAQPHHPLRGRSRAELRPV